MASEAPTGIAGHGGVCRADSPLTVLKGIGPKLAAVFARAHIHDLRGLLFFFPRRIQEVRELASPLPEAATQRVRIPGRVDHSRLAWLPGRRSMTTVVFTAGDGTRFEAAFFNQPYLKNAWAPGSRRLVEGILERKGRAWRLRAPRILPATSRPGAFDVRYADLEGISAARLRDLVQQALARVDPGSLVAEPLPPALGEEVAAPVDLVAALTAMHRPSSVAEHERARRYFALLEAARMFRRLEAVRRRRHHSRGPRILVPARVRNRIERRIPFALTTDQDRAISRVLELLAGPAPMGLLLQGEVGSGKTVVALAAALAAIAAGHQVAFLAPTELLAEQHHGGLSRWLENSRVRVELLTAGLPTRKREELEQRLAAGEPCLVLGTHAMLSARTPFANLSLVIIDEQHRFGVRQRLALVHKGTNPHVMFMTATPIPRTLAFTLFGDLDQAVLRQKPPGRRETATFHLEARQWPRIWRLIRQHVARGEQVYVVCAKIGAAEEPRSAVRVHRELQRELTLPVGLVHGQMPAAERQQVTDAFRAGDAMVLVGTTVLEVGVDVPGATLMVVVEADRFGLATLHQLRGRVGRGDRRSLCVLVGKAGPRVQAACRTGDGFALAEEDLRLRGAGELLGTRQSGLSDLRALDPVADFELLQRARDAVRGEQP